MKKVQKDKILSFLSRAKTALIPLAVFAVQECFYKLSNIKTSARWPVIRNHILSFVIMSCLFFILYGILRTKFKATVALCVIVAVFMIINQFKIVYSSNPVFLRDVKFLSTPETFTDILKENVGGIILHMLPYVAGMLIMLALICFIVYKKHYAPAKKKQRAVMSLSAFAVLLIMFIPLEPVNNVFIKLFFEIDERKNNNTTSNTKYYYQHGVFGGMLGEYLTTILREPEGYDKAEAEAMYSEGTDEGSPGDKFGKPNIIMVFSESLFDITKVDEVEFNTDVMKNFHELSGEGMLVNMISPSFGGISCNPEFEMLTGGSIRYFPDNYIPYMNLFISDKYMGVSSYISELNRNGYITHITSCWSKNLFNVENVYRYMGVRETEYLEELENVKKKGGRVSDDYVADLIIDVFENKSEEPLFYMVLTAENHMPFYEDKYRENEYDIEVLSSSLENEATGIIKAYAQGCYDADMQLRKLYDYIQTFDEPTMLIYYGDHLPFLKSDKGMDVYEKLSYFNTDDELLNDYRMHNTQCLILDNYGAQYDDISYLGYDSVMAYLLNNMDLDLSDYYKWLYTVTEALPAANREVAVDAEGKLYHTWDLPEKMEEAYIKRQLANWNMFVDVDRPE